MTIPYWVQDSVFYQIFPDRFNNSQLDRKDIRLQPWGTAPNIWDFQGGDLRGIIQKIDYLLDLGVNGIYLNPIFQSASTHRYNTSDYYRIDPKLGDMRDFKALLEVAHRSGMRVIIDGVFNHTGRGFFAFNDILENGEHSPYRDWYTVSHFPPDAYSPGDAVDYLAWWKFKSLPKLNSHHPAVRKYMMDVARYWIEQGADGWRLDVPNEIDDDDYWAEFRHVVRSANSDAYLVGEIWEALPRWANDQHFDGLINYPLREAILGILTSEFKVSQFLERADRLTTIYPRENVYSMYNLLGSHDTERVFTLLGGDMDKARLAYTLLFAFPGVPSIYYGDEVGMEGGRDPDCRRAFPWDTRSWNSDLRSWIQKLIGVRKSNPALRRGDFNRMLVEDGRRTFAFARRLGNESILVACNASATRRTARVNVTDLGWKDGRIVHNLLGPEEEIVGGDYLTITLAPWSGLLFA
jgi:cyclomaltodextrinase / maltogenic alpha-amylase / neopullulanase